MPHYYFDICDGEETIEDVEGAKYPDADTAEREARKSVPEIVYEYFRHKTPTLDWLLRIRNCSGQTIRTLKFIDVLKAP
jgi:hypothetical protein